MWPTRPRLWLPSCYWHTTVHRKMQDIGVEWLLLKALDWLIEENDLPSLKFLLRLKKNTVIQCSQVNKLSGSHREDNHIQESPIGWIWISSFVTIWHWSVKTEALRVERVSVGGFRKLCIVLITPWATVLLWSTMHPFLRVSWGYFFFIFIFRFWWNQIVFICHHPLLGT